MTIAELGSLGEFLGSLAVLVTLIYLGIQVRQNAKTTRAESINTALSEHMEKLAKLTATAEDAELFRRFCNACDSLDLNERGRIHALMLERNASYNNLRLLREGALLPDSVFLAIERTWISILRTPGGRTWWDRWKSMTPTHTRVYTDNAIDNPMVDCKPFSEELPWLFDETM